ncbi:type IV pilus modification protein PilV, partial [Pseudomonas viridiflava]
MRAGSKNAQEGMTLIEVLVALLILTVGLLGAGAVQLNALKYTDSSRMTSQASFIAYDMMDRIRANSGANYTVTPPTSGNLSNARDQDLY